MCTCCTIQNASVSSRQLWIKSDTVSNALGNFLKSFPRYPLSNTYRTDTTRLKSSLHWVWDIYGANLFDIMPAQSEMKSLEILDSTMPLWSRTRIRISNYKKTPGCWDEKPARVGCPTYLSNDNIAVRPAPLLDIAVQDELWNLCRLSTASPTSDKNTAVTFDLFQDLSREVVHW